MRYNSELTNGALPSSPSPWESFKTSWVQPFFIFLLKLPVEGSTRANWAQVHFLLVSYGDACSCSAFVPGKICSFSHFQMSPGVTFCEILSFRKILYQTQTWALLSHGNQGVHHLPPSPWQWRVLPIFSYPNSLLLRHFLLGIYVSKEHSCILYWAFFSIWGNFKLKNTTNPSHNPVTTYSR